MSWFASLQQQAQGALQAAQAQAREAADKATEKAKQLAAQAQASVQSGELLQQAKNLAEQATVKAKALASQAAEEAQKALQAPKPGGGLQDDPADLERHGISDQLVEYVSSLTYSMFSDYPLDTLPKHPLGAGVTVGPGGELRLTAWQEHHAMLILQRVEQLSHMRFALCPKRMSEIQFWSIYFTMCKKHLPSDAFGIPSQPLQSAPSATGAGAEASARSEQASARPSASGVAAGAPSTSHDSRSADLASSASTSVTPARGPSKGGRQASPPPSSAAVAGSSAAAAAAAAAVAAAADEDGTGMSSASELDSPGLGEDLGMGDLENLDGVDDLDMDRLAELEDDPELAAYLQEALDLEGSAGEGAGGGSGGDSDEEGEDEDDLDDYIQALDKELTGPGGSGQGTPAK